MLSGTPASLGAAGTFAVLEINNGSLSLNGSSIVGDIGQGPHSTSHLQKTSDQGTFYYDPTATPDLHKDFRPSGGVVVKDLTQAVSDANAASAADAALAATQTLGNITRSVTVTGNGGTNVISLRSLNYDAATLTLRGGANDYFVFNVAGSFSLAQSAIALSGGVTANHVIFNFPTSGPKVDLLKSSKAINGTFLAPYRSVNYHDPAIVNGAVIAQTIDIHSDANLNAALFTPPAVASASISGLAFDYNTGMPIVGETITLYDSLGHIVAVTTTDANGNYTFTGIAAGTYSLFGDASSNQTQAGTDQGNTDGTASGNQITGIVLGSGDNAVGYSFFHVLS